jgi:DNA-binding NtrC family response regulator
VAERAFALFDGHSIECADLPMHIAAAPQPDQPRKQQRADVAPRALPAPARANHPSTQLDLRAALRQHEVALIEEALRQSEGNQRVAAGLLRMPLRTLERKLQLLRMRA